MLFLEPCGCRYVAGSTDAQRSVFDATHRQSCYLTQYVSAAPTREIVCETVKILHYQVYGQRLTFCDDETRAVKVCTDLRRVAVCQTLDKVGFCRELNSDAPVTNKQKTLTRSHSAI